MNDVLDPSVVFGPDSCSDAGRIVWDSETDTHSHALDWPLDTACLRRAWRSDADGGWDERPEPLVDPGVDTNECDYVRCSLELRDGGVSCTGRVHVFGEEVWSGTAERRRRPCRGFDLAAPFADGCADGVPLVRTVVERTRLGSRRDAVLRETRRAEYGWDVAAETWHLASERFADYWDVPGQASFGKARLVRGGGEPWSYHVYDGEGREVLRVEQRNGASVPDSFPWLDGDGALRIPLGFGDAFVTVYDCSGNVVWDLESPSQMSQVGHVLTTVDFDELGNETARKTHLSYDTGNRPSVDYAVTNSYDALERTVLVGGSGTQAHPYDYEYSYDSIGNRLSSSDNFGTATYAANNLNQYTAVNRTIDQLVLRSLSEGGSEQSNNFTYDADGNMTQDDRFTYAYDCENRLVSVTPLNPQFGSRSIENVYDHRSRRIKKNVKSFDGMSWNISETHVFVWDGWDIVFELITFADNTTRTIEYFWGNDLSGTEQGAGGVGGLLATRIDGVFYIPVYGGNGNIMMYVSESGSIAAQYDYDPYGNILQLSGPLAQQFAFGFSTKYHDREVDLIAYQLRTYDPVNGRWLNRDPIEEDGGENLYAFADNQHEIDYLGLDRMITFARRKWPSRYYAGEDTAARNLMRCIERMNAKKKGNCLCFNIQIKDFVLATLEDIGKDVRVSDEVFMFSHGGLLVNGKPWQQVSYTWENPNDKVEELMFPDLSNDVGVNLNSLFAVGVKKGNVFGCYLSPGHRKFKHRFWSTPVSSISHHAANCAMIQERLEQLEIKNKGCKKTVKVSIYEGEFKADKTYKFYTTKLALCDEIPLEE